MPSDACGPGSPADWLRHARSDLSLAKAALPAGTLLEALCFHAQQAEEKAIKAILVNAGLDVPRSHNIGALLELLPERIVVPDGVAAATELTDYAVEARYPGAFEAVTDEEYSRALVLASAVVRWSDEQISGTATG